MTTKVDIPKLAKLANQLRKDSHEYDNLTMYSLAEIIDECIGIPAFQETYQEGTKEADKRFPEDPACRGAFNAGVQWCLAKLSENYEMTDIEYCHCSNSRSSTFNPEICDSCGKPYRLFSCTK